VLKHYNYPKRGLSSTEYCNEKGTSVAGCDKNLVVNFDYSATRFDWTNMPDRLRTSSSDAEIDAVAELLYAVGASVTVRFGEGGSNAQVENPSVFRNFRKHFLLPDAVSVSQFAYLRTPGNTLDTWKEMIQAEIIAGRPVILTGTDSSIPAGHGFVLDGINEEGKVHINLGWGGSSNGYYDVNDIVIGSKEYRFTEDAVAFINLTPNVWGEGARCNGPRGQRCAPEFLCVLDGDIRKVVDETATDVFGQCLDKNTPPPPPPVAELEPVVQTLEASVAKGEWKFFGPFPSASAATVVMSGTGDADLFVKLGVQPSASNFDCRPYRSSSDERCSDMTGPGEFYVAVNGYSAATVSLEITTFKLPAANTAQGRDALGGASSPEPLSQNTPFLVALGVGAFGMVAAVVVTAMVVQARERRRTAAAAFEWGRGGAVSGMTSANPQFKL
jgi:hypothetical protein